jgi:two-component system OmpR family response regulator
VGFEHKAQVVVVGTRSALGFGAESRLACETPPVSAAAARVLVVEDDRSLSDSLGIALRQQGYAVRAASSAEAGEAAAAEFRPDLALLDVRLPAEGAGLELARRLRAARDLPVMFLTAADSNDDILAGYDAGCDDYLVKPFSMSELLARIRALLRRAGHSPDRIHRIGDLVIDEDAHIVLVATDVVELTPKEFELLSALARNRGQVLSKRQLLEALWGYEAYDDNLVEVHISSLRKKLEEHAPRVLHTVRGVGYVLRG